MKLLVGAAAGFLATVLLLNATAAAAQAIGQVVGLEGAVTAKRGARSVTLRVEPGDIAATILDLAGIDMPRWIEGRSLISAMRDGEVLSGPAFSMNSITKQQQPWKRLMN